MKITFLIGNGFDIQCGLKTSYQDFYKYILSEKYRIDLSDVSGEKSEVIKNSIYKSIYDTRDNPETWGDLEFQLGFYTKQLREREGSSREVGLKFLDEFDEILDDLNNYLKINQLSIDTDTEEDYSEELLDMMENFFLGVLPTEEEEIKQHLNRYNTEHIYYQFLSFNYTSTLELILRNSKTKSKKSSYSSQGYQMVVLDKPIYVHGKIDYMLTMGVNDETQISTDLFDEYDSVDLIKPLALDRGREVMKSSAETALDESKVIVIFGMSLGKTDRYWWQKVAEVLLKDKNCKLVIHYYSRDNYSNANPRKIRLRRKGVEDMFLGHMTNKSIEELEQIRKQVYIVTNSQNVVNVNLNKYVEIGSVKEAINM